MRSPRTTRVILLATALTLLAVVSVPLASVAQTSLSSSLLVKLIGGLTLDQQAQVIARNGGIEISSIPALRLHVIQVAPADLPQVLANYQADSQVVNAEENKTRQSQAFPADPLYQNQWSLPKIGWDLVFGTVTPTGSAIVAVLDTGIDAQHPDLAGNVIPGMSILDGSAGTTDPSGHGTWVAGIVAARTDVAPLEGIAGVAYAGVQVMPVTVLDANGLGQDSDVIAGVIWAADHGADVIVMAFSSPGFSQNLQDAIDYAWSKNIVLVAATGNDALSTPTFPAGDRGVMGVSGTDPNDTLVPFSSYGPGVFIAAPATEILTTAIGDAYSIISGTSASAAIVAGAAAFMKAVDSTLTNGIIVGRLARMADPAGTQDQTGNGRINMARALADTGTDFIQPAGAPPVGGGGPFVGPYVAAARSFDLTFAGAGTGSVTINTTSGLNPGTVTIPTTCGGTGSAVTSGTVTKPSGSAICTGIALSNNSATGTLTANPNGGSVFGSWTSGSNFSGCTTTSPCNFSVSGSNPAATVTFNSQVTKFKLEAAAGGDIPTQTAGSLFNIKITAQGASNNTITGFTGQVTISSTGTLSAGSGLTANFVNGVLTSHSVSISNTGNFAIAATGTGPVSPPTGTSNAFDVSNPAPTVTNIDVTSGNRLQTLNVVFTGSGYFSGVTTVTFGSDITVNSTTVNSITSLTANITIASTAATGPRTVTVTNPAPGGGSANTTFAVNNPAPTIASRAPTSGNRLQALNVVFTGTGYITGVTTVDFGSDIIVNSVAANTSGTQLTANITIAVTAATGSRPVTVTNPAPGGGTASTTFTVNNPAPTIASRAPTSGDRLQVLDVVFTGTNYISDVTSVSFGTGITVNSTSVDSATQLTANITITAAAATGSRTVTVTNAGPVGGNVPTTFTVNNPAPTLSSIDTPSGNRLQVLNVVFTGSGYISGVTTVSFGSNITVNSRTVNGDGTQLTANITIGSTAATGVRNVTVTNPTPGGGTATLTNAFTVNNPAPTLTAVNPAIGAQGQTLNVVLTGSGYISGVTTVAFGSPSITVNSTTVNSATQLTVSIATDGAAPGAYDVSVTNAGPGGGTATLSNAFTINPPATLTSINPASGNRLQTLNVVFTGSGYVSGYTTFNFGSDITVNSTTVNSATQLTANITIASTAALGARTVTVTNPGPGGGSASTSFIVNNPPPSIASRTPTSGDRLQTLDVVLTASSPSYISGVTTVAFSGTGITLNSTTVNSGTQLTVNITIDVAAATGARTLTVTNAGPGGGSASTTFTVENPTPTLTSIAPTQAGMPQTLDVVFTGSGYISGVTTVSINQTMGQITVNSVTVTSATQLIATITITAAANPGARNVSVTNTAPGGGSDSLQNAFLITSDTPPAIAANSTSVIVNEAQTASNSGTWSDANAGDTVTLSASVGTITKGGTNAAGTWTWSFSTSDGPAQSQIVTITANDGTTTSSTTFQLTVNNVAPTVAITGAPATGTVGAPISLGSSVTDPSPVDTAAGFTRAWSVTKNSSPYASGSGASLTFTPDGSGTYVVSLTATDKDGGVGGDSKSIAVSSLTSISAVSGSGKFGSTGTLTATLRSATTPLGGKSISFALNGNNVGSAATDSNGVATLNNVSLTEIAAGTHAGAIGAGFAGDTSYDASGGSGDLAVGQATQMITFDALGDKHFGDADFSVTATASSSLAVSFTASGSCTVTGITVHLTGVGSCTITAHQPGDTNYSAAPDVPRSFNITDNTPPDTSVLSGPRSPTNATTATFTFSGTDNVTAPANLTFECQLDSSGFGVCTSPVTYNSLVDGPHTFYVRAGDAAGNVDPTPAQFSWSVDTAPPDTLLDSMPFNLTNQTTANFTFHATEPSSTFECSLSSINGGAFAPCSSPVQYTALVDGSHTFQVRAIDQAHNPDPTPASFTWTVDTQAPDTMIDSAPADPTNSNTAPFTFHGDLAGGDTFQCQLDAQTPSACNSGTVTYTGLAAGPHTFTVTATDTAGNPDQTPASFTWVIDTEAPDTQITAGPADGSTTTNTSASFDFTGTDNVSPALDLTFECSLDGGAFGPCTSPTSYLGLSRTAHTFSVRAKDQAGNTDASPATATWTITKITPVITWNDPADITYPTALSGTQLNAMANVPGSFVYTPATGTVLNAGDGQELKADFTPNDTTSYATVSKTVKINVKKATPTVSVTGGPFTYDGNPHAASVTVTGVGGVTVSGSTTLNYAGIPPTSYGPSPAAPVNAGTYQARAVFTSTDNNYNGAQGTGSITISKAATQTTVTVADATYDSTPHGGAAVVTGPAGLSQSVTVTYTGITGTVYGPSTTAPTNAGSYNAAATYAESANYLGSTDNKNFTINKATPTVSVTGGTFAYNGVPRGATGFAYGVGGVNDVLSPAVTFSYQGIAPTTYGPTATAPTGAGTYQVMASFAGNTNYMNASNTAALTISPKAASVTPNTASKTYGDADPALSGTLTGFVAADGVTAIYSRTAGETVAGSPYTISAVLSPAGVLGNYNITYNTANFTINKAASTTVVTFETGPYVYRATPFTATAQVTGVGGLNSPVAVVYSGDCTNVTVVNGCTAAATFAGDGNHLESTDSKSITITKASSTTVVTFEPGPYVYRGTAFTATAVVTGVGGLNSPVAVVYSGDCANVTGANGCTATATYGGDTNRLGSTDSKSITITQASSTTVVTFEAGPYVYRGTAFTATATVTGVGGLNQSVPVVYSGDCTNVTAANGCTATATYAGDPNHLGSTDNKNTTIEKASSTTVVNFEAGPYVYRATAFTATATVTGVGGLNQPVPVVYSGDCTNVTVAYGCTATATFGGDGNHLSNSDSKSITITKASSTTTATFESGPYTYRSSPFTATASVAGVGGLNAPVTVVYTGDCTNVTGNGCTATATYAGDTNHNGSTDSKSITIVKASSTTVLTFEAGPYVYRSSAFTATAQVMGVGGLNQSVPVVYSGDCTNVMVQNGCTGTVTFAGDSNHDGSSDSKSITINKKAASVTPNVASKIYGDLGPALTGTLSGFLTADAVTAAYSRTVGETVAGSPYTISATLSPAGVLGNYTVTYDTAPFTITKRSASVTPNAASKIYGDADPNPLTAGTLTNFVAADGVSAVYSRTAGETVAGSPYTSSATLSPASVLGNYTITYNTAGFTINKATLTVTADNKSKLLNAPNPPFTASFSGFKNGETPATSGVTGIPSLTTTAITTSPVGSYLITPAMGSLSAANYSFTFVNGSLAVQYAAAGLVCNGEPGHQILQPINVDNTSVFKLGSTVPTKFRVCDANGVSIGTAGVVTSYGLILQVTDGSLAVDESQYSTTPDTAFRWDSSAQQWIFNQSTKNNPSLNKTNTRYYFRIFLNDGTYIDFQYGLK